ncbi:MAG: hypothetical protein H6Q09_1788 [Acidobacteria bacterium]|nr:hypothetical protein [Acidobacteriota bacterium]
MLECCPEFSHQRQRVIASDTGGFKSEKYEQSYERDDAAKEADALGESRERSAPRSPD